ncbi:MAG: 3-deoxy-8-phosphooctulonate synthase, partial [Mucinivorans sp.]
MTKEYITNSENFFLIAGPCVIESEELAFQVAEHMVGLTLRLGIPYIFKGSYRKANRSRADSFTGIGDRAALDILARVGKKFNIPTVTDIHSAAEADMAAEYVDVLQIPAFLCRQTDILEAAAHTGRWVNIKKGQFLSPEAMQFAAAKVEGAGNDKVMLTDRGSMFGYGDLVVDFRGVPTMQKMGY